MQDNYPEEWEPRKCGSKTCPCRYQDWPEREQEVSNPEAHEGDYIEVTYRGKVTAGGTDYLMIVRDKGDQTVSWFETPSAVDIKVLQPAEQKPQYWPPQEGDLWRWSESQTGVLYFVVRGADGELHFVWTQSFDNRMGTARIEGERPSIYKLVYRRGVTDG